ncbi:MAG: twin-arginine translocation signal domain-containing protein [Chromatiaceae bacterium]|nr:MAG: twin-arginine translocation signal domain-containing protein [Chromatiaceae bacterium]
MAAYPHPGRPHPLPTTAATLGEALREQGVSRRGFLKFCAATASLMALPPTLAPAIASALEQARRPSVIWLSFQECTGCTEALTRSFSPTVESLILDLISLDYHHTLQAAAGTAAELAREQAMHANAGEYLVVVDGSLPGPRANPGYSTIAGISNLQMLRETIDGAAAVVAVGTCAAFGGLPQARPNPTGAVAVSDVVRDRPVINVSGCPPLPMVITGVLAQFLTFGNLPELDEYGRPRAFFGQSIHDRCYRRPFYDKGLFAETFDDEGARKGWCLYRLGCKGPMAYNACATMKWNGGTSWPVEAGHPCLGCSEPNFWDAGGFYRALSVPAGDTRGTLFAAGAIGATVGAGAAVLARQRSAAAKAERTPVTAAELEQTL